MPSEKAASSQHPNLSPHFMKIDSGWDFSPESRALFASSVGRASLYPLSGGGGEGSRVKRVLFEKCV